MKLVLLAVLALGALGKEFFTQNVCSSICVVLGVINGKNEIKHSKCEVVPIERRRLKKDWNEGGLILEEETHCEVVYSGQIEIPEERRMEEEEEKGKKRRMEEGKKRRREEEEEKKRNRRVEAEEGKKRNRREEEEEKKRNRREEGSWGRREEVGKKWKRREEAEEEMKFCQDNFKRRMEAKREIKTKCHDLWKRRAEDEERRAEVDAEVNGLSDRLLDGETAIELRRLMNFGQRMDLGDLGFESATLVRLLDFCGNLGDCALFAPRRRLLRGWKFNIRVRHKNNGK